MAFLSFQVRGTRLQLSYIPPIKNPTFLPSEQAGSVMYLQNIDFGSASFKLRQFTFIIRAHPFLKPPDAEDPAKEVKGKEKRIIY